MAENATIQQIIKQLSSLPPDLQKKIYDFTVELSHSRPKGTPGKDWRKFAGTIESDDIEVMKQAIEEGCEQVNADEW